MRCTRPVGLVGLALSSRICDKSPMPDEVHGGGDFPKNPSMEARVSALEAGLVRLEVAVDEIRKELQAMRVDLARIEGKMSNLPTTFQLVSMQGALIL